MYISMYSIFTNHSRESLNLLQFVPQTFSMLVPRASDLRSLLEPADHDGILYIRVRGTYLLSRAA